jgi:type I restriction enzyme S subunit
MPNVETLITDNIDVWTSAIKKRGSQGRGSNKKITLYGIKKLRELILELAVRGLLVPQDLSDEPASVLLKKIASEKEQLILHGKLRKQKSSSVISEEDKPYTLPNGWEWVRLNDICVLENGDRSKNYPNKSLLVAKGLPFVNAGHLQEGRIDESQMTFITQERFDILRAGKFSIGDILYCLRGSLGKSAIVDTISQGAIASSLVIVRLMSAINRTYIHNYFDSPLSYSQISLYDNGTAQPNLSAADFGKFLVPLSPEAEQPRIVAKVDELMALCDQLEQQTESSLSAHQTLVETLLNTLLTAAQTSSSLSSSSNTASSASPQATGTKKSDSQISSSQTRSFTAMDGGNEGALISKSGANSFEQAWNRIAQHFDVLFTTEHSIDQLKQTILQLAVMGKLVPQDPSDEPASVLLEKIAAEKEQLIKDKKIKKQKALPTIGEDEKPFELPVGWEWVRLGEISRLMSGKGFKKSEYSDSGARLFQIANVSLGYTKWEVENFMPLSYFDEYPELELFDGDVLIALNRPLLNKKMKVCILSEGDLPAILYQRVGKFDFYGITIDTRYFYYYMQSGLFIDHLDANLQGSDQPFINQSQLVNFLYPLPSFKEQSRIVAKVDEMMALCNTLKSRISESQTTQLHLADAMAEQALN